MFFRSPQADPEISKTTRDGDDSIPTPGRCPKTGRYLGRENKKVGWAGFLPMRFNIRYLNSMGNKPALSKPNGLPILWLLPVAGLLSLIWFLIRVIPKPSRATYPCQRLAAPLASGFVVWIAALVASAVAYRKARRFFDKSRYAIAGLCVALSVMAMWLSLSFTAEAPATSRLRTTISAWRARRLCSAASPLTSRCKLSCNSAILAIRFRPLAMSFFC